MLLKFGENKLHLLLPLGNILVHGLKIAHAPLKLCRFLAVKGCFLKIIDQLVHLLSESHLESTGVPGDIQIFCFSLNKIDLRSDLLDRYCCFQKFHASFFHLAGLRAAHPLIGGELFILQAGILIAYYLVR